MFLLHKELILIFHFHQMLRQNPHRSANKRLEDVPYGMFQYYTDPDPDPNPDPDPEAYPDPDPAPDPDSDPDPDPD